MKCEICHQAEAKVAITRKTNGAEEELYVCNACAETERKSRQKRSQRTRKPLELTDVSITVKRGEPPPFLHELMNVMNDIVDDIQKVTNEHPKEKERVPEPEKQPRLYPLSRIDAHYRIGSRLHLEGLFLIGELAAVHRALHALDMDLVGCEANDLPESGHAYKISYRSSPELALRVINAIVEQERNARVRLNTETPRIFGDAMCRALALLKNCRLLSPAEQYDLLSPLRLAARDGLLDGIDFKTIDALERKIDLSNAQEALEPAVRDRIDADRADEMNKLFEDVVLNERAEERFL